MQTVGLLLRFGQNYHGRVLKRRMESGSNSSVRSAENSPDSILLLSNPRSGGGWQLAEKQVSPTQLIDMRQHSPHFSSSGSKLASRYVSSVLENPKLKNDFP